MKKEFRTLWIAVAVLAVLQLVGGGVYTAWTAHCEKQYTYVTCTVISVSSSKQEGDDAVTIDGITVSYVNEQGETVVAEMEDFPSSFAVGESFSGRYSDDPTRISAKQTDWFTPVFLIVLGMGYALFDILTFIFRKKMGLYAMVSPAEELSDDEEYEDDTEEYDGEENRSK